MESSSLTAAGITSHCRVCVGAGVGCPLPPHQSSIQLYLPPLTEATGVRVREGEGWEGGGSEGTMVILRFVWCLI